MKVHRPRPGADVAPGFSRIRSIVMRAPVSGRSTWSLASRNRGGQPDLRPGAMPEVSADDEQPSKPSGQIHRPRPSTLSRLARPGWLILGRRRLSVLRKAGVSFVTSQPVARIGDRDVVQRSQGGSLCATSSRVARAGSPRSFMCGDGPQVDKPCSGSQRSVVGRRMWSTGERSSGRSLASSIPSSGRRPRWSRV